MKSKLFFVSFTLFFFNSANAICVPRNSSKPYSSPYTPPNLKPVPSSPSSSAPKDSTPSSPDQKPSSPQQLPGPASSTGSVIDTITSALPKAGGGRDNPGINKICAATDYPDVCKTTLGPLTVIPLSGPGNDISSVLRVAIKAGLVLAKTAINTAETLARKPGTPPNSPFKDCKDSYDDYSYNFQSATEALTKRDIGTMNTMLSAGLTDISDCEDAFEGQNSPLTTISDTLRKMASNCLAIGAQMNK